LTSTAFLLAVILTQQGFFGLVWALGAGLDLARRASIHWGVAALAVAAGMVLVLLRERMHPWLGFFLANALMTLAFVMLRRGLHVFMGRPTRDLEQSVLMLGVCGVVAGAVWLGAPAYVTATTVSLAIAWTVGRVAWEVGHRLADEFGVATARACAAPLALVAGLFGLRGVLAPVFRQQVGQSLAVDTSSNAVLVFVFLALGLVVNATLAAIVVVRLVRRLEHSSDHDALTGLLNRRGMERILQRESARHERFGQGYALLMLDIDHFKAVNDRHGHAAGDAVLAGVSKALLLASREVDRIGRIGGEEFCVLLPSTDLDGAEQVARRMLDAVRALRVAVDGAELAVTVSIGVGVAGGPEEALEAVRQRVDRALYAAKVLGRDRIEVAAPLELAAVARLAGC
jgi:diguanylate cyclase (GGDEF)-like protein